MFACKFPGYKAPPVNNHSLSQKGGKWWFRAVGEEAGQLGSQTGAERFGNAAIRFLQSHT